MKSQTAVVVAAAAFAALSASPSDAIRPGTLKPEQQHLQPSSFVATQSEAQALQTIEDTLGGVDEEAMEDSDLQKKLMQALSPALKTLFESVAKTVKPELKEECDKFIADITVPNFDDMPEEWAEADSFSQLADRSLSEHQQQERLTVTGFWDKVKKHVGSLMTAASPLIEALAKKLGPTVEKLGGRLAPTFAHYIKYLMRKACEQAEQEAGFQAQEPVDF
ncbi:hypothetical protein Efla_002055 [Eimeria flavescens]